MKVLAIILAACLVLLSTGILPESQHVLQDTASMEYCSDQGCSFCHEVDQQEDQKKSCDDDHSCGFTCQCSSGSHFSALAYDFKGQDGVAVKTHHYGNYLITYTFEYSGDLLQPPRKV